VPLSSTPFTSWLHNFVACTGIGKCSSKFIGTALCGSIKNTLFQSCCMVRRPVVLPRARWSCRGEQRHNRVVLAVMCSMALQNDSCLARRKRSAVMKHSNVTTVARLTLLTLCTTAATGLPSSSSSSSSSSSRPHIVYVLADNLGWGGVSYLRATSPAGPSPEVVTPNLDSLAHGGVILNSFYTWKVSQ
jgi:hypothetical protein